MDEMERRTQQARRFYRRRGESSPACVVCVCGMHACGWPGGLPLGSATHLHSVAIATQPVHRLQIPPILQTRGIPTTPPNYIRVRAIVYACGRGQTDRQTQTRVTTMHFSWSTTHAKCNKTMTEQYVTADFDCNTQFYQNEKTILTNDVNINRSI